MHADEGKPQLGLALATDQRGGDPKLQKVSSGGKVRSQGRGVAAGSGLVVVTVTTPESRPSRPSRS